MGKWGNTTRCATGANGRMGVKIASFYTELTALSNDTNFMCIKRVLGWIGNTNVDGEKEEEWCLVAGAFAIIFKWILRGNWQSMIG